MIHQMRLKPTYFDLIKAGEKIYEIRLNDEKRQKIKVGDEIIFTNEPEPDKTISTQVVDLIKFKSFKEMANTLPLNEVGFHKLNADEVVEVCHHFYTPEEENQFGVLAIKLKLK